MGYVRRWCASTLECLTGDVFHSLRCDCRAQLELSLNLIAGEGRGLLHL